MMANKKYLQRQGLWDYYNDKPAIKKVPENAKCEHCTHSEADVKFNGNTTVITLICTPVQMVCIEPCANFVREPGSDDAD